MVARERIRVIGVVLSVEIRNDTGEHAPESGLRDLDRRAGPFLGLPRPSHRSGNVTVLVRAPLTLGSTRSAVAGSRWSAGDSEPAVRHDLAPWDRSRQGRFLDHGHSELWGVCSRGRGTSGRRLCLGTLVPQRRIRPLPGSRRHRPCQLRKVRHLRGPLTPSAHAAHAALWRLRSAGMGPRVGDPLVADGRASCWRVDGRSTCRFGGVRRGSDVLCPRSRPFGPLRGPVLRRSSDGQRLGA
jgi:hypothetical protein